jgi:hypothetical protein
MERSRVKRLRFVTLGIILFFFSYVISYRFYSCEEDIFSTAKEKVEVNVT